MSTVIWTFNAQQKCVQSFLQSPIHEQSFSFKIENRTDTESSDDPHAYSNHDKAEWQFAAVFAERPTNVVVKHILNLLTVLDVYVSLSHPLCFPQGQDRFIASSLNINEFKLKGKLKLLSFPTTFSSRLILGETSKQCPLPQRKQPFPTKRPCNCPMPTWRGRIISKLKTPIILTTYD